MAQVAILKKWHYKSPGLKEGALLCAQMVVDQLGKAGVPVQIQADDPVVQVSIESPFHKSPQTSFIIIEDPEAKGLLTVRFESTHLNNDFNLEPKRVVQKSTKQSADKFVAQVANEAKERWVAESKYVAQLKTSDFLRARMEVVVSNLQVEYPDYADFIEVDETGRIEFHASFSTYADAQTVLRALRSGRVVLPGKVRK
jgi:hypothetical protein